MLTDCELILALKQCHSDEIYITLKSVELFNEVHRRELDLQLGYSGLYEFAEHLRARRVSMTSLAQAQVAFRREDARRIKAKEPRVTDDEKRAALANILDGSSRKAERVLAEQFPKLQPNEERVKFVSKNRVMLLVILSDNEYKDFEAYRAEHAHVNPENRLGFILMHAIKNTQILCAKPNQRKARQEGLHRPPPKPRKEQQMEMFH